MSETVTVNVTITLTAEQAKEAREFIARWLMEFGSGPVTNDKLSHNDWHLGIPGYPEEDRKHIQWAFDVVTEVPRFGDETTQLNQDGLNFLGESHGHDT